MSLLENAVQLKKMLMGMEKDIGFDTLSSPEKSVFYAVVDLNEGGALNSNSIRSHAFVHDLTSATFYRALKSLIAKGFIMHEVGTKTGHYRIGLELS